MDENNVFVERNTISGYKENKEMICYLVLETLIDDPQEMHMELSKLDLPEMPSDDHARGSNQEDWRSYFSSYEEARAKYNRVAKDWYDSVHKSYKLFFQDKVTGEKNF